jgi:hypothetical protein
VSDLPASIADQIQATEEQIQNFIDGIVLLISKGARKILRGIKSEDPKALEVAKALGGLQTALKQLGLTDRIANVSRLFDTQLRQIREAFRATDQEIALTVIDRQVVDALVSYQVGIIEDRAGVAVDSIRSQVMRNVLLGQKPDMDLLVSTALQPLETSLVGELNTAMAGFNRAVTFKKAQDHGVSNFLYLGPLDKITRPFCRAHVNKIYTQDQIDDMPDQQGLPVALYGGGYNCRHRWQPLTDQKVQELLEEGRYGITYTMGE